MDIEVTFQENIHVLKVSGQLDALTAPDYEQRLNRVIAAGAQRLVVDFGALVYISSAGLRALLNTTKPLMAHGGSLIYVNLQPGVREIFEMTGLLSLFHVCDSMPEALAEISVS
ncbi:STAS domain-containing protein [uncultured Thiocystis sp.]|jgi:anti-anti-sigma factor|uniref:STAS domain-containing protein n=1 Tax=uncultured Thiocystis sp. TaxID=1202134 RepID=UPI0025EF26B2|nr:STAS domain-containing protein [uncultured Thiocystis sp.]